MIVAGIGCRRGVEAREVIAAIEAAIARYPVPRLDVLATAELKRGEPALMQAAGRLGVPLVFVGEPQLRAMNESALTRSERVVPITGGGSLAESAALAAAGQNARLAGPRLALGSVTCAIASDEILPEDIAETVR